MLPRKGSRMLRAAVLGIAFASFATAAMAQTQSAPVATAAKSSARVVDRTFQSKALGRTMAYRVLLPEDYASSERRYPVLYLLHGWNGGYRNWETLTRLDAYAGHLPMIIIMPEGENSWYVDSATVPANRFEQYLAQDLIEDVDQSWRTLRSGHQRAIAGLSMGGYGAVKLAVKHPGLFAAALSLSGAFNGPDPALETEDYLKPSLEAAFGPAGSSTRRDNDLFAILKNVPAEQVPYLFVSCGSGDSVHLAGNRKLAALLSERSLRYEYHEYPGRHDWQYWDEQLPLILKVAEQILR